MASCEIVASFVDANGSQLVVGQHVSQSAGDYVELANGVACGREVKEPTDERLVAMRDKLRTEEGKALYGRRNHTGEPVFGIIKTVMGFRGVSLCGKEKVSGEWTLVCLAYNLKRLHRMVGSVTNGAGGPKSPSMVRKPSGISLVSDWLGEIIHSISPRSLRLLAEFSAERAPTPTGSSQVRVKAESHCAFRPWKESICARL